MENTPETIEVTFQEIDVNTAGPYLSVSDCLMATALRRMGYENIAVVAEGDAIINGEEYNCSAGFSSTEVENGSKHIPPFYKPEMVGKTFTLTRKETQW